MSLDLDTTAALIAVLAASAYLLRGALAAATRFLAQSRAGTGPRICKGCGGGSCKAPSAAGATRVLLAIERGPRGS